MAKKLKDTDYLFISTYLHSRERDLLTGARMERMIEAPTAEEAANIYQVDLGGTAQAQVSSIPQEFHGIYDDALAAMQDPEKWKEFMFGRFK